MSCCKKNETSAPAPVLTTQELIEGVREHYRGIAEGKSRNGAEEGGCGAATGNCYVPSSDENYAKKLGYREEDLVGIPTGANLGQGEISNFF